MSVSTVMNHLHLPTEFGPECLEEVLLVDSSGEWQFGLIGGIIPIEKKAEIILKHRPCADIHISAQDRALGYVCHLNERHFVRFEDIAWSDAFCAWIVREVL
jgi:hypothetical protein